jgi:hypothetical protein
MPNRHVAPRPPASSAPARPPSRPDLRGRPPVVIVYPYPEYYYYDPYDPYDQYDAYCDPWSSYYSLELCHGS